jgi:agmatine/peptidylarginine deiminase
MKTPVQDGFRMPAEWEPHAGTWMLWPERHDNWRNGAVPAQRAFTAVASAIAKSEPVTMGVLAEQFEAARAALPPGVRVVEISANDSWMRDVGPTFVVDRHRRVRGVDWMFNAWGGKAGGAQLGEGVGEALARALQLFFQVLVVGGEALEACLEGPAAVGGVEAARQQRKEGGELDSAHVQAGDFTRWRRGVEAKAWAGNRSPA